MIIHERKCPKDGWGSSDRLIELACSDLTDLRECQPIGAEPQGGRTWIGTETVAQFDENVRYGWPRLERRMMGMLGECNFEEGALHQERVLIRRRARRGLGNEVDIHAVYQGRIERAWDATIHAEDDRFGGKLVDLVVNIDANAYIGFEDALWRGAVVMRLYEALTNMGKSVAVTVYDYAMNGLQGANSMCSVRVKAHGEQLLSDKLASMVNVGFMRRYHMEHLQCCHPTIRAASSRGRATNDYRVVPRAAEETLKRGGRAIIIGHCFSKEASERVLRQFIAQYVRGEPPTNEHASDFRVLKDYSEIAPAGAEESAA